MLHSIKKSRSILCAVLFLIASIITFAYSESFANISPPDNCKHCGSISACENGGQSYGYQYCDTDESESGTPEGCAVWGERCGLGEN